jgi:hypothetical protein
VAAFTIGLALLTGILFGLFPALHVSNPDLSSALKEAGGRAPACDTDAHGRLWSSLKLR